MQKSLNQIRNTASLWALVLAVVTTSNSIAPFSESTFCLGWVFSEPAQGFLFGSIPPDPLFIKEGTKHFAFQAPLRIKDHCLISINPFALFAGISYNNYFLGSQHARLILIEREAVNNTIQMILPPRLYQQVQHLIAEGWFKDENELLLEALRRFLEAHHPELMEQFIREDVEWGLHGKE